MFQNTYQLLTFIDSAKEIHGRKRLQKMIHLLKSSGTEFTFKYRYHHYGPYSAQLQSEMDELVKQGFVRETKSNGAYQYTITDSGKKFKQLLETSAAYSFAINDAVLNELVNEDTQFLEMFSTYVFLRESGDNEEQAKIKVAQLKPHLITWLDKSLEAYDKYIVN